MVAVKYTLFIKYDRQITIKRYYYVVRLMFTPSARFVSLGGLRHTLFWSIWYPAAGDPPWGASAHSWWGWWHFQWTSDQLAGPHSAKPLHQRHLSAWSEDRGMELQGLAPRRKGEMIPSVSAKSGKCDLQHIPEMSKENISRKVSLIKTW